MLYSMCFFFREIVPETYNKIKFLWPVIELIFLNTTNKLNTEKKIKITKMISYTLHILEYIIYKYRFILLVYYLLYIYIIPIHYRVYKKHLTVIKNSKWAFSLISLRCLSAKKNDSIVIN